MPTERTGRVVIQGRDQATATKGMTADGGQGPIKDHEADLAFNLLLDPGSDRVQDLEDIVVQGLGGETGKICWGGGLDGLWGGVRIKESLQGRVPCWIGISLAAIVKSLGLIVLARVLVVLAEEVGKGWGGMGSGGAEGLGDVLEGHVDCQVVGRVDARPGTGGERTLYLRLEINGLWGGDACMTERDAAWQGDGTMEERAATIALERAEGG